MPIIASTPGNAEGEQLTKEYAEFSAAAAENFLIDQAGQQHQYKATDKGRGNLRWAKLEKMAPKKPEHLKTHFNEAETIGLLRSCLHALSNLRHPKNSQKADTLKENQEGKVLDKTRKVIRKAIPLMKSKPTGPNHKTACEGLEGILTEGTDRPTATLKLKCLAKWTADHIQPWIREGHSKTRSDFSQWVQEQIQKGSGGLHRLCNQEYRPQGLLEEVIIHDRMHCTQQELMEIRTSEWTGWWGTNERPDQMGPHLRRITEEARRGN